MSEIKIPESLLKIEYNDAIIPDNNEHDIFITGANCQFFVFTFLRMNGYFVPDLRSDELWDDKKYSIKIYNEFLPFDILLFNESNNPFGAHVGVYIGDNNVLHNSKKIGRPKIETLTEMTEKAEYKVLIGGKRFCLKKVT